MASIPMYNTHPSPVHTQNAKIYYSTPQKHSNLLPDKQHPTATLVELYPLKEELRPNTPASCCTLQNLAIPCSGLSMEEALDP